MSALISGNIFFLDSFAMRQWDDPAFAGTRMTGDKTDFVRRVHAHHAAGLPLVDGYAPFCKHLFIPNEWGALVGSLPITDANRTLLRSGYASRRPEELPVLTRWFPTEAVEAPPAKMLDIILYSREQMLKEYEAMPLPAADKPAEVSEVFLHAISDAQKTPACYLFSFFLSLHLIPL
jgi:hypothetical protein